MVRLTFCVLALVVIVTGCDTGNGPANQGVVDITITNIDGDVAALGTVDYGAYLYQIGTEDIYDPANCIACNITLIGSEEETLRLKVTDGNFNPTTEDWIGDAGWAKYDLYILIDRNGTGDAEEGVGDRINNYPGTINIDGDTAIRLNYFDDLIEY